MLPAVRELQPLLLAVMLIGGCASKAWRALRDRSIASGIGPTGLFPWRLRRPIMIAMCVVELSLGIGIIATVGRSGGRLPANTARACTALFFLIAVGTLYEARQRDPGAGCGCFGELSDTPIGFRTIARAALLCVSAAVAIGAQPLRMPSSPRQAALWLALFAAELVLIAALSPEVGEVMTRLGYSEPCELRRLPVARTMATLRISSQWRRYAAQLSADAPVDVWREGCWRFVVFPGIARGRRVDIVFAVYLQPRRPPIRVAVLDQATNEVLPLSALP
jgi:hypothetical protein